MAGNESEECYPTEKNALLEWKNYLDFGLILLACVIAFLCLLNGVSALWDYHKNGRGGTARRRSSRYIRQRSEADEKVSQCLWNMAHHYPSEESSAHAIIPKPYGALFCDPVSHFDVFSTQSKEWEREVSILSSFMTIS